MGKTVRRLALVGVVLVLGVLALAVVGLVVPEDAVAKGKPGGGDKCPDVCPRPCIACADIYDPVICSDGNTYGNACYAYVACATGCVSTGGGPVE